MAVQGVVAMLSSQICRNIFIGPSPESDADIFHITQVLRCNAVLNVSDREFIVDKLPESTCITNYRLCYKHIPLTDGGEFPFKKMVEIIEFANRVHLKDPDKYHLYIHCYGGMSRSAAAVAAIFIGWGHDPDEVKRMLERRHSSTLIHPDLWRDLVKYKDKLKGKTVLWNPKRKV
jgi:hypothetical protein